MKILIFEDEPLVARSLLTSVKSLEPEAAFFGPIESVKEAITWFGENPLPDLILADIQLSDGVSFDIFRQVPSHCPIIFTTAYDEYAIRAFKLNSVDYLLKPIDPEELRQALAKFKRNQATTTPYPYSEQLNALLNQLESRSLPGFKRRFLAHYHRTVVAIAIEKVAFFVRDEVIWLVTTDGQRLITDYASLDELEELLDPAEFFRANRKYCVRKNALEGYRTQYTGKLELVVTASSEEEITVSKEKAPLFRSWFEDE